MSERRVRDEIGSESDHEGEEREGGGGERERGGESNNNFILHGTCSGC